MRSAFSPRQFRCLALALSLVVCVQPGFERAARGEDGWDGDIIRVAWENDALLDRDRHYTHGTEVSYLSSDDNVPRWIRTVAYAIPSLGFTNEAQKWGVGGGQEVYTPEDLDTPLLVVDDRPYAGWLYGTVALQRRGRSFARTFVMETFRLDLGVIGQWSLAEDAQSALHGRDPAGWRNQLRDEVGFALRYERRQLFAWNLGSRHWRLDFVPRAVANAGTVDTSVGVGGLVRVGYHVPNEFEVAKGPPRWGAYLWTAADGRYVARNIFLDGNTFEHSHHVTKEPWVGSARFGLTLVLRRVELSFAHVLLTPEFKKQAIGDAFLAVTMAMKF